MIPVTSEAMATRGECKTDSICLIHKINKLLPLIFLRQKTNKKPTTKPNKQLIMSEAPEQSPSVLVLEGGTNLV